jgi:LPS-assembly protein
MSKLFLIIILNLFFVTEIKSENINNENVLEANKIEYLNDSGKILATGSVLIIRDGYKLQADKVSLDPSKNLIEAEGNIRIKEKNGNLITAAKMKISSDLNDGIIELPKIISKDGTVLSSSYAIRNGGNATILRKGIFSPCNSCESNKKRVSWQIKANRIIHDEINGNIIYEGARFELFGVPIFYIPIAGHPSPEVKRRSGFLAPSLVSSGDLGIVLKTPYYIDLRQDYDLTISPWLVTKGAFIFENEWRQKFKNGELNIYAIGASLSDSFKSRTVNINKDWQSVINSPFNSEEELNKIGKKLVYKYDDNNHAISNVEVASLNDSRPSSISEAIGYDYRGSLSARGNFKFNGWKLNFDGTFVSDDTFLRRFDLNDNTDITSIITLSKNWDDYSLKIESTHFTLLLPEKEGSEPIILPSINFKWNPKVDFFGGKINLNLNSINIVRKTDGNTQRVSLDGSWKKKIIHKSGNLLNLDINLRGDLYRSTKKYIPNNSSRLLPSNRYGEEISIARFLPSFSVDWSYPVISPSGRTIIEPTISVTMATNDKEYLKIPNEDSLAFELSSSNIFDSNRIQGFDRWEYGNRFNYGLKISHYWNERVIKAMIGQSYRFSNLSFAYTGSGIRKDFSDIIFDLLYKPNKKIVISYRGRVSEEDLGLVRSEFDIQGNFKKWGFRLGHAHLDNEENINLKEQKELRFANFININKNWLIQGAVRYDIESKKSLRNRLSVVYIDDCISFELGFRRKFAEYRDLKPSNSFMIKLNVYTFGGGNINNTQRLTKLWERVE